VPGDAHRSRRVWCRGRCRGWAGNWSGMGRRRRSLPPVAGHRDFGIARWNGGGLGNGWQKSRARTVVGWVAQATGLSRRATRLPLGVGRPSPRCAGKGRVGRSVVSAEARRQVATDDGPVARSTRIKSVDPEDRGCSMPIRICDPQALTADGRAGRAEALPSAIRRDKVSKLALPAPMFAVRRRPGGNVGPVGPSVPQKSLKTVV